MVQTVQNARPTGIQYLITAAAVLAACWLLFSLDKETHSFADLLTPGNLVALAIYFLPTYMLCCAMLDVFIRRHVAASMAKTLFIGIPSGFSIVICFFYWKMG